MAQTANQAVAYAKLEASRAANGSNTSAVNSAAVNSNVAAANANRDTAPNSSSADAPASSITPVSQTTEVKTDTPVKVDTPVKIDTPAVTTSNVHGAAGTPLNAPAGVKLEVGKEMQTQQPDYRDTSEARHTETLNNLNAYYASNPGMFNNSDIFKTSFNYKDRSPTQQARLDSWYKGTVQVKQDTLDTINGTVSESTTTTVEPTGVDKLLASMGITYNPTEHVDLSAEYESRYNKSVQPLADDMAAAKLEVDKFKRSYEGTLASLRKQYEGTGATDTYIRALAAKKQEDELPQYQNAIDNYNNAMTIYNSAVASLDKNMSLEVQQAQIDAQEFNQKLSLYQAARQQEYQSAQLDTGKFTAIADGFGGITVLNTKTGEFTSGGTSLSTTPSSSGSSTVSGGVTNESRAGYTPEQKKGIIDQMRQMEGKGEGKRTDRNNNPTAMTIDVAKQGGLIEGKEYVKGDAFKGQNGQTYYTAKLIGDAYALTAKVIDKIGFFTQKGAPRWSYVSKLGGGPTGGATDLGYQKDYSSYYQLALDGKGTIKDAILAGYKGTPQQFTQEMAQYNNRISNALKTVGVNKDDFAIKVETSLGGLTGLKTEAIDTIRNAIYNKIVEDPSLAKAENASKLWTTVTGTTTDVQTIINGIKTVQSDWKKMTDEGLNTYTNWAKYGNQAGTISAIGGYFGVQPTGTLGKFISSSKLVAQFLAKLVEKGRLSDQDRVFYQTLMPQINTPSYDDGILKLQNINDILMNQGAPGEAGNVYGTDTGL